MKELRAILNTAERSLKFIKGGNSIFTFVGKQTRFTYKVSSVEGAEGRYFVSLLSGADNNNDYRYMGMLFEDKDSLTLTKNSKITSEAQSFRAFNFVFSRLSKGFIPDEVTIYHEGRCAKCGKRLTTPESIETGFGPICASR